MSLTKKTKEAVAQRAGYCCEYCRSQEKFSPSRFSVDHIIPTAKLGEDDLTNLCYACQACNNHKYTPLVQVYPINIQSITLVHGLMTCTHYYRVYRRTSVHAGTKKAQTQCG